MVLVMQVDIPVDPFLHDLMKSCKVELDAIGRSEWSYYSRAFIVLAPSVFILLQVKHFSNRAMEMTSEKILDLLKMDREHLILVTKFGFRLMLRMAKVLCKVC